MSLRQHDELVDAQARETALEQAQQRESEIFQRLQDELTAAQTREARRHGPCPHCVPG